MKAIIVKYMPATDRRGSRCRAKAEGVEPETVGFHEYPYPFKAAAARLIVRMGWTGEWHSGSLPTKKGNEIVLVCARHHSHTISINGEPVENWLK